MTIKELIDVLQRHPNQDYTVMVQSKDPFRLLGGIITIEEVFLGKTKLPVIVIGEKND